MNMSSLLAFGAALAILVITLASPERGSDEFKVGDAEGWRQPGVNETEMYDQWITGKELKVGDSVSFEYKNDSVLVVDKWGYYHCDTSNPDSVFNDGNTTITLDNPGPIYFISGNSDHCNDGQKLLINVMPLLSPTIASPPQPYSEESPAPSPLSSSGTSFSSTIAAAIVISFVCRMAFAIDF